MYVVPSQFGFDPKSWHLTDIFSVGEGNSTILIWLRECGKECYVIKMIKKVSHMHIGGSITDVHVSGNVDFTVLHTDTTIQDIIVVTYPAMTLFPSWFSTQYNNFLCTHMRTGCQTAIYPGVDGTAAAIFASQPFTGSRLHLITHTPTNITMVPQ